MYEPKEFEKAINGMFEDLWKVTKIQRSYDPERYELVEKKGWKIKQLKNRIDYKKNLIEEYKSKLRFYEELITVNKEALINLEKELKELE